MFMNNMFMNDLFMNDMFMHHVGAADPITPSMILSSPTNGRWSKARLVAGL
jgi:hypothetical protein